MDSTQEKSPRNADLIPDGAKEATALIVYDPENESSEKSGDTNKNCPPHVLSCLSIVYACMKEINASREDESSQHSISDLMKCRVFDVHVDDGDCRRA